MKTSFFHVSVQLRRAMRFFVPAILCSALFSVSPSGAHAGQAPLTVDRDLVIPLKNMSSTAIYYPVRIDGNIAEFFAVKAPDNTIRVVVNACQACGPAGFTQERENFTCRACGQKFHVSTLEGRKGGCNPIPVGDKNKKVDADSITLEKDFLRQVAASRYAKGRSF